jgi:hypothetical protein
VKRTQLLGLCGLVAAGSLATGEPDHVRYQTERATLYFEAGQLTGSQMERFAAMAEQGIADIESFLGTRSRPAVITFRIDSEIEMSRAFRRTVWLPMQRVKSDSAPYLHETAHVLLPTRCHCPWLGEGFASYVQAYVSENIGGYDGVVFSRGGNPGVDRLARRYLATDAGQAVLPYVGGEGAPPGIEWDRRRVAAPFYVLSHSFVKFLVERTGLEPVKSLHDAAEPQAALQRLTGRSVDYWLAEWLAYVRRQGA